MNRYVIAGYVISIGSLFFYGLSVAARAKAARRRAVFVNPTAPSPLNSTLTEAPANERRDAVTEPS